MVGGELVGAVWATAGVKSTSHTALLTTSRILFPSHRPQRASPSHSVEVAWFYLQSELAPANTFGRLSATSTISDGSGEGKPRLFYTMSMDAFVPVPEPGTFVLVSTCLAGALIRRRYQKQKGTIT